VPGFRGRSLFLGPATGSLSGHAFGNLLLALTGITGSFDETLLAAQRVLALRGQVLPSTLDNVTLVGEVVMPDGETRHVAGESAIPKAGGRVQQVRLEPPDAPPYPPTLRAIFGADLIVLGPGSLYTSILPNLLLRDLAEALIHARAPVVYVCNLATQPGETDSYSVADHVACSAICRRAVSTWCWPMTTYPCRRRRVAGRHVPTPPTSVRSSRSIWWTRRGRGDMTARSWGER
jgi:uncharacterized cofD-like protein